jgi:hypothetical protein
MRYTKLAKLAFALLGFDAILFAADPFVGTWKMNSAKTKYETGTAPKEQTVTIAETGGDLDVTVSGTAADGSAIMSHYTVPAQGGEGKIIQSPYGAVSGKRMGSHEREVTYSKGGKEVLTTRSKVSANGKTITVTVKGTDAQDKPVAAVVVYDKQ